jgi:hypothetical protein
VIKNDERLPLWKWFAVGLLLGFAFNIRFQCILFAGGFGLALLIRKKWLPAIVTGLGFLVCAGALQGITDYFIWGHPFVEFKEYVRYNLENARDYFSREWYMYFTVLAGILVPPISLFLLFGFFRSWRKYVLLFLPAFVFLAFHSYFPNKQERFILPIMPFVITLGIIGWHEFVQRSAFWQKRQKLLRACWIFFWCVNFLPLCVLSVAYTKRSRVESMCYLAKKGDVHAYIVEGGNTDDEVLLPRFYLGKWRPEYYINNKITPAVLDSLLRSAEPGTLPDYVVFVTEENITQRVERLKKFYPRMKYEATIEPSFIDWLLHRLNPVNQNESSYIYRLDP